MWDLDTGEKFRLELDAEGGITLDLSPAGSMLIVFDKEKRGEEWKPLPTQGGDTRNLTDWEVEFHHSLEGWSKTTTMAQLQDLKETEWVTFTGTVTYRKTLTLDAPTSELVLNLGKVYGVAELTINGEPCGVRWHGRRLYAVGEALQAGENTIEIKVTTTMGNYMQTLSDNPTALYWTNRPTDKRRVQPIQSMGLEGPVTLYKNEQTT